MWLITNSRENQVLIGMERTFEIVLSLCTQFDCFNNELRSLLLIQIEVRTVHHMP